MGRGEILHALIPAAIVSEVDQLLDEHRNMLTCDGGDRPVVSAASVRSVASSTGFEQLCAVFQIRRECQGSAELIDGCSRVLSERR